MRFTLILLATVLSLVEALPILNQRSPDGLLGTVIQVAAPVNLLNGIGQN